MGKRYICSCRPLLSVVNNSVSEEQQQQQPQAEGGLFGKWPWYPLIGLGAVTAISKEILILNDELVYVGMFLAFTTGVYIQFGPQLSSYLDSKIAQQRNTMLDCCDIAIDTAKRFIIIENRNKSFPEDLRNLFEEEMRMTKLSVDYQNKKHRIDIRDAVLQKLSTIKALEDEATIEYKKALRSYTVDYVKDKYSELSPHEKENHLNQIIDQLPTKAGSKMVEDLVMKYFQEFLDLQYKPEEMGVTNRVPAFLKKDAAQKTH